MRSVSVLVFGARRDTEVASEDAAVDAGSEGTAKLDEQRRRTSERLRARTRASVGGSGPPEIGAVAVIFLAWRVLRARARD